MKYFKFFGKKEDYEDQRGRPTPINEDKIVLLLNSLKDNLDQLETTSRKWEEERNNLRKALELIYKHCQILVKQNKEYERQTKR